MTLLARAPAAPAALTGPLFTSEWRQPRRSRTTRREWALPLIVLILAGVGALLVWSATRSQLAANGENPQSYLYRHLLNMGVGLVLLVAAARTDLRRLRVIGPLL